MPVKMTDKSTFSDCIIEHETMSVGELIAALQTLNPNEPIRAVYDAGCASGDIKTIERSKNGKEFDIVVM